MLRRPAEEDLNGLGSLSCCCSCVNDWEMGSGRNEEDPLVKEEDVVRFLIGDTGDGGWGRNWTVCATRWDVDERRYNDRSPFPPARSSSAVDVVYLGMR